MEGPHEVPGNKRERKKSVLTKKKQQHGKTRQKKRPKAQTHFTWVGSRGMRIFLSLQRSAPMFLTFSTIFLIILTMKTTRTIPSLWGAVRLNYSFAGSLFLTHRRRKVTRKKNGVVSIKGGLILCVRESTAQQESVSCGFNKSYLSSVV